MNRATRIRPARGRLHPAVLSAQDVGPQVKTEMFELFSRYYEKTSIDGFTGDLEQKDLVLVLRDESGAIAGFTTLSVYEHLHGSEKLRFVFSGDTILASEFWGDTTMLRQWFRMLGTVRRGVPDDHPLYWFLITKGHRTYRVLTDFFIRYVPSELGDQAELLCARDSIAVGKYGLCYDGALGLIDFDVSAGQLRPEWADAAEIAERNAHTAFFLSKNPEYWRGVELACLAPLETENLRGYARAMFDEGLRDET